MLAARLRALGVLGMNQRNGVYTSRWNERRHYPSVDDKLETKRLLLEAGIATAPVLAVARQHSEVRRMLRDLDSYPTFVIKPAHGAMGNGILVVLERDGDWFMRVGGQWVDRRALSYHSESIISGAYALGGQPDVAFAEERLQSHPEFRAITAEGVPDVRVVVYRGRAGHGDDSPAHAALARAREPASGCGGRGHRARLRSHELRGLLRARGRRAPRHAARGARARHSGVGARARDRGARE